MCQKREGDCGLWVLNEKILNIHAERKFEKNRGSRLGVACTANPAQPGWKWAGLAVLFSIQLPNGSHDLLKLSPYFFKIISLGTHKPQSPSHF